MSNETDKQEPEGAEIEHQEPVVDSQGLATEEQPDQDSNAESGEEDDPGFSLSILPAGKIAEDCKIPKEQPIGDAEHLIVPGGNQETINGPFREILEKSSKEELAALLKTKWPEILEMGADLFGQKGADLPFNREGSEWTNNFSDEGRRIGLTRPRIEGSSGNMPLTGVKAMAKASAVLGIGSPVTATGIHSGFSLTIKQPLNADLINLEASMALMKSVLGRATAGRVFSSTDVFIKSAAMNFILDFVIGSNLVADYTDKALLKEYIKLPDVNLILTEVAAAIYPKGFLYTQPCLSRPGNCMATFEGLVNINEMLWMDKSYLTSKQRSIISRPGTPVTPEIYKEYHEAFALKGNRSFVSNGIRFDLRIPSFAQYENEGIAWVEEIRQRCEMAFQKKMSPEEREEYILSQGQATAMRQYSHWIERIVFLDENGDENGYIEDREDLANQLGVFTNDENIAKDFYDKVEAFISDCTIGVVAVPNFVCPSCVAAGYDGKQPVIGGRFDHLIALDPAGVFFTLTSLRLTKMREGAGI